MARISGIDLPRDKRIEIALTYIFGIGLPTSQKLLAQTGVSPDVRVKDLSGDDENKLREAVDAMKVEGDLRREIAGHIKRLTDIGPWLRDRIATHFRSIGAELNLKYIDPSYQIRSVPANPHDSVYCVRLAHNAVHAALSGRTETVIGRWRGRFVHVPMALAIRRRNTVDPHGDLWMSVLEATGQPRSFA